MNEEIEQFINTSYQMIEDSSCRWYKRNYGKCIKLNPIKNAKRLSTVIEKLNKIYLENSEISIEMQELISFIRVNMEENE